MHRYLGPVEDLLTRKYAVVGILEEFDTTLALFNATLGVPGLGWSRAFREAARQDVDRKYVREEAEVVLQSRADPDIQATLWMDILLCEHAVGVFNRQAKEHDVMIIVVFARMRPSMLGIRRRWPYFLLPPRVPQRERAEIIRCSLRHDMADVIRP